LEATLTKAYEKKRFTLGVCATLLTRDLTAEIAGNPAQGFNTAKLWQSLEISLS
jgi:hypothetical protein